MFWHAKDADYCFQPAHLVVRVCLTPMHLVSKGLRLI